MSYKLAELQDGYILPKKSISPSTNFHFKALSICIAACWSMSVFALDEPTVPKIAPAVSLGFISDSAEVDTDHDGTADRKIPLMPRDISRSRVLVADINGDFVGDVIVYQNGVWKADLNGDGKEDKTYGFGKAADIPLVGDYDGDGVPDLITYSLEGDTWRIQLMQADGSPSTAAPISTRIPRGANDKPFKSSDVPLVGDFDRDGKADLVMYAGDGGKWTVKLSSDPNTPRTSTGAGSLAWAPAVADYDGDGVDDFFLVEKSTARWTVSINNPSLNNNRKPYPVDFDFKLNAPAGALPFATHLSPGAEAGADTSYLTNAGKDCTHYVKADVKTSGDGVNAPWKTIREALAKLRAGDVGCIYPGTYDEMYAQNQRSSGTAASGTKDKPIVLRALKPKTATTDERPVIQYGLSGGPNEKRRWDKLVRVNHNYWIFDGLRLREHPTQSGARIYTYYNERTGKWEMAQNWGPVGFGVEANAHHVALRNSELTTFVNSAPVHVLGKHVLIDNNEIHGNVHPDDKGTDGGIDIHGVVMPRQDPKRATALSVAAFISVVNNKMVDNAGDGVQCESELGDPFDRWTVKNIYIDNNEIYTTPSFRGRTENAIDIKACANVTIRGGKYHGFRSKQSAPGGAAVVTHYGSNRLLITRNLIKDSGIGIAIARKDDSKEFTSNRITIRHNLVHDIRYSPAPTQGGENKGNGIQIVKAKNVLIYNNTISGTDSYGLGIAQDAIPGTVMMDNVRIFNNIFHNPSRTGYLLSIDFRSTGRVFSDRNVFHLNTSNIIKGARAQASSVNFNLETWQNTFKLDRSSLGVSPQFKGGSEPDAFQLNPGSPAVNAGLLTPASAPCNANNDMFCIKGSAIDIGFVESH